MRTAQRTVGRAWLKAFGWEVEGTAPALKKAVVVAAPHTSNWDFPFTLATAWTLGLELGWVGKHTMFKGPWAPIFKAWGGVPVDRRAKGNFVAQIVELFDQRDALMLVIAPEGTRSRTEGWKTGFYWMAVGARVPIVLGYLDYGRKRSGLGKVFEPTGDAAADLEEMRAFYEGIRGKHADRQ